MGLWQASSSLNENISFVHPEQDEPFDRKNRDLLEEQFGIWPNPPNLPSKNIDDRIKVDKAREHVNENGIYPDDGQWERPFSISADVNEPIEKQQHQARPPRRQETVGGCPHLHDHRHSEACCITSPYANKSYPSDEVRLAFLRARGHEQFAN